MKKGLYLDPSNHLLLEDRCKFLHEEKAITFIHSYLTFSEDNRL